MFVQKGMEAAYTAVLRSPGMDQEIKVSIRSQRRDILLLHELMERCLREEEKKGTVDPAIVQKLRGLSDEFLSHANFTPEFIESWNELTKGKSAV